MTTVPLQHQRYLSPPCTNSLPLENINIKDKDVLSKMPMFMSFFATRYDLIKSNIEVELSILSQFLYKNHNRFRTQENMLFKSNAQVYDQSTSREHGIPNCSLAASFRVICSTI